MDGSDEKGFIACIASLLFTAITFATSIIFGNTEWCGTTIERTASVSAIVDNIEWHYTVEDGNATIHHSGSDYWSQPSAIPKETSGTIIIPTTLDGYPVVAIGEGAFSGCSNVMRIMIHESVTSIADSVFSGCSNLTHIEVAEGNTVYASLDGVVFSKMLSCVIRYPMGKAGVFTIPEGVKSINNEAFSGCSLLTKVKIPASIISIAEYAVPQHSSSHSMSNHISMMMEPMFTECSSLTDIYVSENNMTYASVNGVLFDKALTHVMQCPNGKVGTFTIPASVTSIGKDAFDYCSGLTSIDMAKDNNTYASVNGVLLDKVRNQVIRCPEGKVGTLTIPAGITSIGDDVFKQCSQLTSIMIPASVTSIGKDALWDCTKLATLFFGGHAPTRVRFNVFNTSPDLLVYYHEGATGWTNPWYDVKTQMIPKD